MRRVWVVVALLAAVIPAAPALARETISLNGEWECVFGDPASPPGGDARWDRVTVPSVVSWRSQGPHCLWYRKQFYVPPGWSDRSVVLRLEGVKYSHVVYVNGRKLGGHMGGYEPAEYDATGAVTYGARNEVLVAVQDWTSLIAPGAEVGPADPSQEVASWVKDGVLAPIGSRGWEMGIWQGVSVSARAPVWVKDVFVKTSVRNRTLGLEVTVRNDAARPMWTVVSARVASGGEGPAIAPQGVMLKRGEEQVVKLESRWPNAHLWSPDDPHLYSLIVGARAGGAGDSVEVRFGFREFWVEGDRFLLNGTPINFLATAAHPMPQYDSDPAQAYRIAKSVGCVAMRLHAQPWPQQWYDAADETGMLLIWESGLWCLSGNYAMTRDEFWQNARDHLTAQVRLQRNHPSIVIWSAENELLLCGGDRIPGAQQKVGALADLVRSLDPTRPVMFDGDADPAGKADIVNLHYPHDLPAWTTYPETAYWFDEPVVLDTYPGTRWVWDHKKPLYLGEFLWVPAPVHAGSVFFGDAAYPDVGSYHRLAKAAAWEMQVIAARDAGVTGMCPWNLWEMGPFPNPGSEAHRRAYQPVAAFVREAGTRVFAGSVAQRTLMVFNDSGRARSLDVRWRLAPLSSADGAWAVTGSQRVRLEPAGRTRLPVALAVPVLAAPVTNAAFTVEVWEGDQQLFSQVSAWKLYGRGALSGKVPGAPGRVALYDPKGQTGRLLAQLGIEVTPIDERNARDVLRRLPVAIVGKGAFEPKAGTPVVGAESGLLSQLEAFVRAGGVLLVFEQTYYPSTAIPASLSDHDSTIAFPRAVGHPVLAGVEEGDLAHWQPDGIVGRREILKPDTGGFLAVTDSGSAGGLATAGIGELRVGSGRMVLCQLDVTSKFGFDPIATRVFRNLLAYAAKRPEAPVRAAALCGDAAASALDAVGLRYDRLATPLTTAALSGRRVVIADAAQVGDQDAVLRRFVRDGGTVVLHNVNPGCLDAVQRMVGVPVPLHENSDGRVTLSDRTGVAMGMSNQELCWFGPTSGGGNSAPPLSSEIADYVLWRPYEAAGPAAQIQAEAMAGPDNGAVSAPGEDGLSVELFTNAELRSKVSFPRGSWYEIAVRARGTRALGAWPRLELRVDGVSIASAGVPAEDWTTVTMLARVAGGTHDIGLAFTNDAWTGTEDRNVWIEWMAWQPVELKETPMRFYTEPGVLASIRAGRGTWVIDQVKWDDAGVNGGQAERYLASLLTNLGCQFELAGGVTISGAAMAVRDCDLWNREGSSVALATNGSLDCEVEFARAGRYTLAIFAGGTPAAGVFPRIEVAVDGVAAGAVQLTSGGMRAYRLTTEVGAGKHRITLSYTNDAWAPPEDRNLVVGGLTIGLAEAPPGA